MTRREKLFLLVALAAVVIALVPLARPLVWRVVAPREESAARRGETLAASLGCFSCHGPGGVGGVPNPGAEEGDVPAFAGGVPMMYADDRQELRNWILWGDKRGPKGSQKAERGEDRDARPNEDTLLATSAATAAQDEDGGGDHDDPLLEMPSFRPFVTDAQVEDLLAFIDASSPPTPPPDEAARRGYDLAIAKGCFGCHGPMGSGGHPDPGSFKGYVPGWFGGDLSELAADDAEIAEWIRTGTSKRVEAKMGAKRWLAGEAIKMPAYRAEYLSDAEVADLVALVKYVHSLGPAPVPTGK